MTRRKTHDVMSSQTGADSSEPETAATKQMQGFQGSLVADSSFLVIQFGSKLSKLAPPFPSKVIQFCSV